MQKHFTKFLQSVVVIPLLATSFAVGPFPGMTTMLPTAAVISSDQNRTPVDEAADNKQRDLMVQAAKIDAYFGQYDATLTGHGYNLAKTALEYDLPVLALAGMAMTETRGGDMGCAIKKKNPYGYGSCKITFDSLDEATTTVARALAGENAKTSKLYKDKTFEEKLRIYNGIRPDGRTVDPRYVQKIKWVMGQIEKMEVSEVEYATVPDLKV